ncbi:MAG: 3-deoxy-7-phosphoheptulonate synthase [Deltaproteobacteria bacterium]|nr:3-deoxy-7-phosphoheptulonate synthase [Deltaproteobacteria bacterium]
MISTTDDVRVESLRPLVPAAILIEEIPLGARGAAVVEATRRAIGACLRGEDDRVVVVCGPCSIHDVAAAREYATRLAEVAARLGDALVVVMRVYFEKPRTTVGWKGLINDPDLDGTFRINKGLRLARGLLQEIGELGLAAGSELLDTITPQVLADLLSWGAIGARTTESQVHRELASGLSMPVGFKNATSGSVAVAVDAVLAARHPHAFLGVTKQGLAAIVQTRGNESCHVILRGGAGGRTNYDADSVADVARRLGEHALPARVMVDASHGNSGKDPRRQPEVVRDIAERIAAGATDVFGVMLESHLVGGRQDLAPGRDLTYGQSITDACLAWDETTPVLERLADAVRARRAR